MPDHILAIILFVALLVFAVPVVRREKHPALEFVAAYTIFVLGFGVAALVTYGVLMTLMAVTDTLAWREGIPGGIVFVVLIFAPAQIVGQALIRQPPRPSPNP